MSGSDEDEEMEVRHWAHNRSSSRPTSASTAGRPPPSSDVSTARGGQRGHVTLDGHLLTGDNRAAAAAHAKDSQHHDNKQQHQFEQHADGFGGEAAGGIGGSGELLTMQIRGDAFAFTTAIYANVILFFVAVTRVALALNFDVIDSLPSSGALWIVVSNAFAAVVFVYSFFKFFQFSRKEHQRADERGSGGSSKKQQQQQSRKQANQGGDEIAGGAASGGGGGQKGVSRGKYDVLDTVWGVAWASAVATTYCEGGSGGGLTVLTLPLFVVIAPAFRVSLLAIIPVVTITIGIVLAIFTSHFPGAPFRRFELPLLPAMVLVNFISTAIIAAWVSHRRTLETQQLSDHYTAMLRVVASTAEHLLLLRSSDAASHLLRLSSELCATPQERRVVGGLAVLSWFLAELASYFPPHIADAARLRLLSLSNANSSAAANGGGVNPQLVRESRIVLEKVMAMHGQQQAGGAHHHQQQTTTAQQQGMTMSQMGQQALAIASSSSPTGVGGSGVYAMLDGDEYLVEEPYEEDPFSQMRKKLCTVMQITLLDFPTHDVKQAATAGQWLADCTVEFIETHEGVVESMTPSSVVASFNFHTPCPVRHARLACDCALAISAAMAGDPDLNHVFAITIDTTQIVGGAMGAGLRRTVSIAGEGLDTIARLAPLANILASPILLTERVQRIVGSKALDIVPVDVADIKWFQRERQRQFVLYELRGSRPRNASTALSDLFTQAFKAFRGGDLAAAEDGFVRWEREARRQIESTGTAGAGGAGGGGGNNSNSSNSSNAATVALLTKIDFAQSKRLKAICTTYRRAKTSLQLPKPFVRRNTVWQLFLGEMPSGDPFFSPLGDRLKAARNLLRDQTNSNSHSLGVSFNANGTLNSTFGGGGAGAGSSSPGAGQLSPTATMYNSNPEATPMQAAFKRLREERQAKIKEDEGGIISFFTVEDDDDDALSPSSSTPGAGSNDIAMSPSYEGGLQRPGRRNSNDEIDGSLSPASAAAAGAAAASSGPFGATTVPLTVTDFSEDVWTRSNEPIGNGGFSEVYLGLGHHGMLVAMKFFLLESTKSSTEDLKNEVELLSKLKHDNIVSYVECSFTPTHFVIIMEYVSGGSLEKLLRQFGPLPLLALRKYLGDILRGLEYLHSQGSVHCDVKPHNALLHNDGVVKLTDFGSCINANNAVAAAGGGGGFSSAASDTNDLVVRGTPHYMAPEAARNTILPTSDVWSVGVTVLELALGRVPWQDKYRRMSPQNMVLALSSDDPPVPEIPDSLHPDVQDFVRRCLVVDPAKRASIDDLWASPFLAA